MITSDELHAFVIGFCEVLCPWKPRKPLGVATPNPLEGEYHYYLAGRAIGLVTLILIVIGLCKLGKELLL